MRGRRKRRGRGKRGEMRGGRKRRGRGKRSHQPVMLMSAGKTPVYVCDGYSEYMVTRHTTHSVVTVTALNDHLILQFCGERKGSMSGV